MNVTNGLVVVVVTVGGGCWGHGSHSLFWTSNLIRIISNALALLEYDLFATRSSKKNMGLETVGFPIHLHSRDPAKPSNFIIYRN